MNTKLETPHARDLQAGDTILRLGVERTVEVVTVESDVVRALYVDGSSDTFPPSRIVWRIPK